MSLFKTGPVPHPDGVKVTTSGTAHDWLSIPAWVRRITISFRGVSLSGTDNILVQLGDAGGIEDTGYISSGVSTTGADGGTVASTAAFIMRIGAGTATVSGHMTLTLHDSSINAWTQSHVFKDGSTSSGFGGGDKALSQALDRVRLTRTGTNTFDAGSAALFYE